MTIQKTVENHQEKSRENCMIRIFIGYDEGGEDCFSCIIRKY